MCCVNGFLNAIVHGQCNQTCSFKRHVIIIAIMYAIQFYVYIALCLAIGIESIFVICSYDVQRTHAISPAHIEKGEWYRLYWLFCVVLCVSLCCAAPFCMCAHIRLYPIHSLILRNAFDVRICAPKRHSSLQRHNRYTLHIHTSNIIHNHRWGPTTTPTHSKIKVNRSHLVAMLCIHTHTHTHVYSQYTHHMLSLYNIGAASRITMHWWKGSGATENIKAYENTHSSVVTRRTLQQTHRRTLILHFIFFVQFHSILPQEHKAT